MYVRERVYMCMIEWKSERRRVIVQVLYANIQGMCVWMGRSVEGVYTGMLVS